MSNLTDWLTAAAATLPPGTVGCGWCDAEVDATEAAPGVVVVNVRHDNDCPVLSGEATP